ncbi:MAG: hypothetical protein M3N07_06105 [Pseudomonadota bacterium]|nr:hypothetical protein [Pseudomonadota bacterium]
MRTLLVSAALLTSLALAAPADAQYRGYGYREGPVRSVQIERQIDNLVHRIRRAEDRDLISRGEEERLLRQASNIARRYDHLRRNGLSPREHQELQHRIHQLRQRLHFERREGRWENRRDRWDDRDNRWEDRHDRWDDRHERWEDRHERREDRRHRRRDDRR